MTRLDKESSLHLWIRSETTQMKKNLMMITLFLRRYIIKLVGNAIKLRYIGRNYPGRRIKDCDPGKQQSFAIITNATVSGDCTDRVISQHGDRVIFEWLATPRPAPKVTLKSNWRTQQQQQQQPQQPILDKGVNSIWKQRATWESRAGVRDDTKHATEVETASKKLVQATSEVDVGTHVSEHEVITVAFSNNEANTQDIERVKIGSNKICIREDLATDMMVFSKESSRAVFEMGNVELIELKK